MDPCVAVDTEASSPEANLGGTMLRLGITLLIAGLSGTNVQSGVSIQETSAEFVLNRQATETLEVHIRKESGVYEPLGVVWTVFGLA